MRGRLRAVLGTGLLATALVVVPVGAAAADDSVVQFEVVDSASSGVLSLDVESLTQIGVDGDSLRYLLRIMVQGRGTLTVSFAGEVLATRSIDSADEPLAVEVEVVLPPVDALLHIEFITLDGLTAETADVMVDVPDLATPETPGEDAGIVPVVQPPSRNSANPLADTGAASPWAVVSIGASLTLLGLVLGARARRRRTAGGRRVSIDGEECPMA